MICNGCVTVYKFNKADEAWEGVCYPHARISGGRAANLNNKGDSVAASMTVRIPSREALPIEIGDRLVVGTGSTSLLPDGALLVTGVFDNRTGSKAVWHYRLVVE